MRGWVMVEGGEGNGGSCFKESCAVFSSRPE